MGSRIENTELAAIVSKVLNSYQHCYRVCVCVNLFCRHDSLFDEASVRFYLAEIVVAVHSLHCLGYIHRYHLHDFNLQNLSATEHHYMI